MADIDVEFAPAPVGGRRRRLPPTVAGLTIVALLAVAVAKPWANGPVSTVGPALPTPAAAAAGSPGLAADGLSGLATDPPPVPTLPPVAFAGPPRAGSWGVGLATDTPSDATGSSATWIVWAPLDPVSDRPEPPIRDPLPMETGCSSVPTLAAAPSIVGLTVPPATTTDVGVLGWWSDGPSIQTLDGSLVRLDIPGSGAVAELARTDRQPWPDGRYEFHILTPSHVTALAFCIGSAGTAGQVGLDPALVARIVSGLAPRSGTWGVGTGGDGPHRVIQEPWSDWVPVDPVDAGSAPTLGLWPGTGLCPGTPHLRGNTSLVAVTVPSGLVPDWRLVGWWTDGSYIGPLDGIVRQISPPGNRGISYLERLDEGPWPDGRYEFHVLAGDHEMSLTVCIGVT